MKETPEQCINRVIDRLQDILNKGNRAEKRQLAELLEHDETNIYCALCEVEDVMQQRLDLAWTGESEAEPVPEILQFPNLTRRKRRVSNS